MFGRYLIEKKTITAAQLIAALSEQIQTTPPLVKILSELADAEKVIAAVNIQMDEGISLSQAQASHGIFSPEVFEKALARQREQKKPLGWILVEQGALDFETLELRLGEYLADAPDAAFVNKTGPIPTSAPSAKQAPSDGEGATGETEISEAALESLKELIDGGTLGADAMEQLNMAPKSASRPEGSSNEVSERFEGEKYISDLDEDFIEAFLEEVSLKRIKELNSWLVSALDGTENASEALGRMFNRIHRFKGAATLVGAGLSAKVMQKLEDGVKEAEGHGLGESAGSRLREGLQLVMALSKLIEAKKDEATVLQAPKIMKRINRFLRA